jgi:outer membrane receptor protein involved in Fe transport
LQDPGLGITTIGGPPLTPYGVTYQDQMVLNSMELQHILQTASQRLILGGRYQVEDHHTVNNVVQPFTLFPVSQADLRTEFNRLTLYSYYQLTLFDNLRLTGGATYDHMRIPVGIANPPISGTEEWRERVSPKAGIDWTPGDGTRLRAAYTRSVGGLFNDSSTLIEPSEVAGFNQDYRTLLGESTVPGTQFETWGAGIDHKFPTHTYVSLEGALLNSTADQLLGEVHITPLPVLVNNKQVNDFKEKDLSFNINQLIGKELAVGAGYHLISASLAFDNQVAGLPAATGKVSSQSTLHEVNLFANYNLPCGFFSQFQANWWDQANQIAGEPGDSFWQFNLYAGYRFPKRHIEIQAGVLNLANQDYRLDPLTYYIDSAHTRTYYTSLKFNF